MKSLVQELRAQLERVVRDPTRELFCGLGEDAASDACRAAGFWHVSSPFNDGRPTQAWRIAVLTAAIRAAVVTREAQP